MNTITINDIIIEFRTDHSMYITKGDWTVYMDDGIDGEKILSHWIKDSELKKHYKSSVIEY